MKSFLKQIVLLLVKLWSCLYSYDRSKWFANRWSSLYSMWMSNFVGALGVKSCILPGCQLQGGGKKQIFIGDHTCVGRYTILGCWMNYRGEEFMPSIHIGNYCSIGEWNHITAINKITIGDGLLTGHFVYIGDNSHGGLSLEEAEIRPGQRKLLTKGEVVIGRNVWLGDKVTVLSGVTIGDNVIVAANAVVTHDLPSNCMAAGVPARVMKKL